MDNISALKDRVCAVIDEHRDEIIALGESIRVEPELGYKEFKTFAKVKNALDRIGLDYESGMAITGVIAQMPGRAHNARLAIMGELDAVVCPGHPQADPVTGAAHSCGHFAQIAATMGAAMGLKYSGVDKELDGDIEFWAVPAEEAGEVEWRKSLIDEGKISFLGGKQEFIALGYLDNIDLAMMIHSSSGPNCGIATTRCSTTSLKRTLISWSDPSMSGTSSTWAAAPTSAMSSISSPPSIPISAALSAADMPPTIRLRIPS